MMRCFVKVFALAALMVAAIPLRASAAEFTLNLAGDRKVTISVAPQDLRFVITNRLPTGTYSVSVTQKIIPIPAFSPLQLAGGFASAECDAIATEIERLEKAADEKQAASITLSLRNLIVAGKCTDQARVQAGNAAISHTVSVVDGSYPVSYGVTVTVLVARGNESWEFVFDGGARGEWLTTYGFAINRSDDQAYFAKASGASKFVVTQQRTADEDELDLVPSVYYTWLPRRFANRAFSPGITAGLGVTDSSPGLFIGGSLLHNWNLQLAAGVSIFKQLRLDGNYSPAQELAEFIAPDKLNRGVFKLTFSVALSLRLGGNPFAKAEGGDAGKEEKPATAGAKPEGEKKTEGK